MRRDGRVGDPDERWPGTAAGVLLSMTFVSGLVDAVAFLAVGHLFVAMVTGNIMFLGFTLAGAPGHSAPELLTAVASFFVGAVVGAPPRRPPTGPAPPARPDRTPPAGPVIAADDASPSPRRPLALTCAAYAGLLVTGLVIALVDDVGSARSRYAMVVVLGLAMGMQNATGRRLGVPEIPTNVLTTQLTMIAAGRWHRGGPDRSTRRRAAAPAAMLCGALVGAATYRAVGVPAPLALASLVAIAVTVALGTGRVCPP